MSRKEENKKYYAKHKEAIRKRYDLKKQKLKEQENKQITEHLEEHPNDLNFNMRPVRDSFPNYSAWKEANPDGKWEDYMEEREEFFEEQRPRELDSSHLKTWSGPLPDCCERCGKSLPEGWDGKLCMDCRLSIS